MSDCKDDSGGVLLRIRLGFVGRYPVDKNHSGKEISEPMWVANPSPVFFP